MMLPFILRISFMNLNQSADSSRLVSIKKKKFKEKHHIATMKWGYFTLIKFCRLTTDVNTTVKPFLSEIGQWTLFDPGKYSINSAMSLKTEIMATQKMLNEWMLKIWRKQSFRGVPLKESRVLKTACARIYFLKKLQAESL